MTERRKIAFYAPMKPPNHPRPSGDREIARLTLQALERAGFAPVMASDLRSLDLDGDAELQARLQAQAKAEVTRLIAALRKARPAAWFTYHCHYKAPDLVGPSVARALDLPYVISEPSISPKRREGAWAAFAKLSEDAIDRADCLYWSTARDRPALEAAGYGEKLVELAPFLDIGSAPAQRDAGEPISLLTVAMMRRGDKAESYRRLAAALAHLKDPWRLTAIGSGPAEREVLALLAPFGDRVTHVAGLTTPDALRPYYEAADLLVWPGVNEGVGMAWLEAQAAGLPVIAEDGAAASAVIGTSTLCPPDEPAAFAAAIARAASARADLSRQARHHVERRHGIDAAAATLGHSLSEVIG